MINSVKDELDHGMTCFLVYVEVYKDLLLPSYTEQVINLLKQMKNSIGEIKKCLQQKTQK